jgi:hypothetical protein
VNAFFVWGLVPFRRRTFRHRYKRDVVAIRKMVQARHPAPSESLGQGPAPSEDVGDSGIFRMMSEAGRTGGAPPIS